MKPETPNAPKDKVMIAVMTGTHGVRGMLKIKNLMTNPSDITAFKTFFDKDGKELKVSFVPSGALAKVDGIDDRNTAMTLKGTEIFVNKADLPKLEKGEYYASDLIGQDVLFSDGTGKITQVLNFGASDIFEIDGKYMVPFADDFVDMTDGITVKGKKEDFK